MKNALEIMKKINKMAGMSTLVLCALFIFNSCKHDKHNQEFVGPGICPSSAFVAISPFAVSATTVDLNSSALTMTATFNEAVDWTITITGSTSGAQRIYSGRSTSINQDWRGEPGKSGVFFTTEQVNVVFKLACKDPQTILVNITANNFSTYAISGRGVLLSDFNTPVHGTVANTFATPGYNATGWSSYFTLPNQFTQYGLGSVLTAPEGNGYMVMKGTPGPTSWYVGGGYATMPSIPAPFGTTTDDVYFNAFIAPGNPNHTNLTITITSGGKPYNYNTKMPWGGFKMVSLKFSEFLNADGLPFSDPLTVTDVQLQLGPATQTGQLTEANFDFIMITVGEPFLGK